MFEGFLPHMGIAAILVICEDFGKRIGKETLYICILCLVWCLIVSIPDLCPFSYFN